VAIRIRWNSVARDDRVHEAAAAAVGKVVTAEPKGASIFLECAMPR
jgi:hypothetical protein